MHRARAMGLHAAFGAAHRRGGFRHVEFLPVTQQKRFALTRRQPRQRLLDDPDNLTLLELPRGIDRRVRVRFCRPKSRADRNRRLFHHLSPAPTAASVHVERTFWRRKWSWIVFCRMRWNSIGSSAAGLSAYFSVSLSIASCTMSSAASSSRTANIACLNARRSTSARNAEISWDVGQSEVRPSRVAAHYRAQVDAAPRCAPQQGLDRRQRPPVTLTLRPAGRSDAVLQKRPFALPSAMPQASAEIPQGCGGCFENAAFYPKSLGRARPSPYARRDVVQTPARSDDARDDIHHSAEGVAMQLTGAEIVIRCLQEEGVEYVFGYPGGAVLNIYDELFKQDKVKHVLVRHEQGAVHAADGYSRSSTQGRRVPRHLRDRASPTRSPGIATAYMDSIPMVVLTGQVPTHAIGQDAFQECDTVGITRPCVKHNFLVKDVEGPRAHDQEGVLSRRDRPARPVLVDIPKDVTQAKAEYELSEDGLAALVQPGHQGARRTDQEGRAAAARGEAADGLRRRRRDPQRRRAAADAARAPARLPVHEHADGAGRGAGQSGCIPYVLYGFL